MQNQLLAPTGDSLLSGAFTTGNAKAVVDVNAQKRAGLHPQALGEHTGPRFETRHLLPGEVRPPRVSAAGVCLVCLRRCGGAAECLAYFERALWQICPECDGVGWHDGEDPVPCGCWCGVVEATPASLAASVAARPELALLG